MVFFFGCDQRKDDTLQIRFGQFLDTSERVSIALKSDKAEKIQTLSYSDLSEYITLPSSNYTVTVSVKSKPILKKKIGLARGAKFTLIVYGKLSDEPKLNAETTNTKLHRIVSGEEAKTDNGFLPQLRLLDDQYEGGQNSAELRWVNLVPYEVPLSITGFDRAEGEKSSSDFGTANYAKVHAAQIISPADYTFILRSKNSPLERLQTNVQINAKKLHTLFVVPDAREREGLKIVVGQSN